MHADLGGRIPHVWAGERSTLDLLGPGLTLFAGARRAGLGGGGRAAAACRSPSGASTAVAARAVGAPGGSALLVRPDGTPVGVLPAAAEPAAALRAAVAAVTAGRRVP